MENHASVDQKIAAVRQRVTELIAANPSVFAEQGTVVESWRKYRDRRLGPYFRLAYRSDGRQRSVYMGANGKLAEEVRGLLADLRAPRRQRQTLSRLRRLTKKSLTNHKKKLREELAALGLYLQGNEFRGMRNLTRSWVFE